MAAPLSGFDVAPVSMGFGAVLVHEQADSGVRPIPFVNRATLDAERSWTVLDLEVASIVRAIKRLRVCFSHTHLLFFRITRLWRASSRWANTTLACNVGSSSSPPYVTPLSTVKAPPTPIRIFFRGCLCRRSTRTGTVTPVSQSMTPRAFISFVRANGAIMIVRRQTSTWVGFPLASDEMCCHTRL